ncbi:hydroxyisourate hydrolase [Allomeiothermus silvanus]|uniref:hydroxyisourate hydrolase n=1 Tax=Allomeiothermus silvanus TaxID=52022 RepID=UPI0023529EF4|nr:hydroxyisourate hydrolase [Allomeiothermus silvanus]MBI5811401.1 hydroxyisourate hydrolase [Allomeiothermus silvanus]
MPRLSTHVLDTYHGAPAAGMTYALYKLPEPGFPAEPYLAASGFTDADGRALLGEDLEAGVYELVFWVGEYFAKRGVVTSQPPFLDTVPVRFGMTEGKYHVPLLCSPWSYSTYRGS